MAEPLRFSKMHGAGNDFVVLDLRDGARPPDAMLAMRLADRHMGVGCDQILTIEPPRSAGAVAAYGIWNADGSPSGQCGNGARCVAAWLVRDGAASGRRFVVDSPAAAHEVEDLGEGRFSIGMGVPRFAPADVPLAGFGEQAEYALELAGRRIAFGAVSMGNPHAVIEVADAAAAEVAIVGPALQRSAAFPQSCNVGFAQVLAPDRIRLRVYERGTGETLACGSGACAAVASLARRGRIGRQATVSLPGGDLSIHWPDDGGEVIMAGPAAFVFEGEWRA
ncbi:diaminopimelate epimerase [Pseudoxanthomonas broegbernensis]|uniref:Diaminopimelate epimerase n=1 Tax=Pseudoxanthomonas broegbernensis TaxID=83619 RepID=A0A7V8K624_9GAMM|nr:diaminopimelate epimerase [Pseudoxanthomonas broegbernensis]KAF1685252.1 diaminopimelate epimerase [Pseudoxanthomonas broegbernensis]MBB6066142.1 diaminopimelate epimerase [Pseudoxanthomonas broegbernensis]